MYSSAHTRDLERLRLMIEDIKKISWNERDMRNPANLKIATKEAINKEFIWVDLEVDQGTDEYEGADQIVLNESKIN